MSKHITGFRVGVLMVFALILFAVSQLGYGQSTTPFGQTVQCQPFQQTVKFVISSGDTVSIGTFKVATRVRITIEQVSMRIDAINTFVAPTVAALVTTVGPMTSAYYVPIPIDESFISPSRPLALMQAGPLYADGGTTVTLSVSVDPRYTTGSGRAEWSVSGQSCAA